MNDESTLFDLLPAYALGALSDEERTRVEAFLATSEAARTELRNYEAMLAGYATLAPARKAPTRLTEDFRRRLAAESTSARDADRPSAGPTPPPAARPPFMRRRLLGLAAVLVLLVGLIGVYAYINDPQRVINEIVNNPKSWAIKLNPQPGTTGEVSIVVVPNSTKAVLIVERLPGLPDEKQYQLWMRKNPAPAPPESVVVFSPTETVTRMVVTMSDVPQTYLALGITIEPRGGSPGPTGPGVFSWRPQP
jgi:anti-sigma-K factor RskA